MDKLFLALVLALASYVGYVVYKGVVSYQKQMIRDMERTGKWNLP